MLGVEYFTETLGNPDGLHPTEMMRPFIHPSLLSIIYSINVSTNIQWACVRPCWALKTQFLLSMTLCSSGQIDHVPRADECLFGEVALWVQWGKQKKFSCQTDKISHSCIIPSLGPTESHLYSPFHWLLLDRIKRWNYTSWGYHWVRLGNNLYHWGEDSWCLQ